MEISCCGDKPTVLAMSLLTMHSTLRVVRYQVEIVTAFAPLGVVQKI
jgi:hypothetical protein